jgi:hypothetical protein
MTQPPPISPQVLLVPGLLALLNTVVAFASHAEFGTPGDHPLPLLVLGCLAAFGAGARCKDSPYAIGFAALAGFPIEATIDLMRHGQHSLELPFEFGLYAVYGFLGAIAARLGRTVGVTASR